MERFINADSLVEKLREVCAELDDGNRDIDNSTCLMTFRAMHEFIDLIPAAEVVSIEFWNDILTKMKMGCELHTKDYADDPNEYYRGWKDAYDYITTIIGSALAEEVEE